MADEYLQQQDEVTDADEGLILLVVAPGGTPEESTPQYITLKNLRVASRIFFKRPGGGFIEMSATDDDGDPIQYIPWDELPA